MECYASYVIYVKIGWHLASGGDMTSKWDRIDDQFNLIFNLDSFYEYSDSLIPRQNH